MEREIERGTDNAMRVSAVSSGHGATVVATSGPEEAAEPLSK